MAIAGGVTCWFSRDVVGCGEAETSPMRPHIHLKPFSYRRGALQSNHASATRPPLPQTRFLFQAVLLKCNSLSVWQTRNCHLMGDARSSCFLFVFVSFGCDRDSNYEMASLHLLSFPNITGLFIFYFLMHLWKTWPLENAITIIAPSCACGLKWTQNSARGRLRQTVKSCCHFSSSENTELR